jgi:hypothetical protein
MMGVIGLMDVDGHKWPNLPLMKISAWHKNQGDRVEWHWGLYPHYTKLYKSKVFDFTADIPDPFNADEIEKGGTGYGLQNKLSDEIEHTYPDYELYKITDTAYGFLTRGCPRQCEFCIVSKKEGAKSHKVADLSEFWSGQKEIKLLDPNLLASPEADQLIQSLSASKAYVDFSQGLDIRLMDKDRATMLKRVKIRTIHFAWDDPKTDLIPQFERVKGWLGYGSRKLAVYVLTNFNSSHDEDVYRVETLRRIGFDPYVMIYDKQNAPMETRRLQRYVNNKIIFKSCKYEDYRP